MRIEEMRRLNTISVVALVLLTGLVSVVGRGSAASGAHPPGASKIRGVVLDANGSRIVGARVQIENARLSRVVQSGEEGTFEVELPAGSYRLTAEMNGFKRFVLSTLRVRAGALRSVDIRMEVEPPRGPLKIE